jgi:hypothetical protein
MAITDGKILLPTSIAEVAEVLGESTRDLGRLCVSERINKFSRSKPINVTTYRAITDAERIKANNGLVIPKYGSLASLREAVLSGSVAWDYNRPSKYYRLTDFAGYNHSAEDWALDYEGNAIFNSTVFVSTEDNRIYDGTEITHWIDYEDPDHSASPLLYPNDWNETSGENLRALRLGLVLISTATSEVWIRSNEGTLAEGYDGLISTIPSGVIKNVTWTLVPVLTDRIERRFVNNDATAVYIPLEGTYMQRYKLSEDPNGQLHYSGEAYVLNGKMDMVVNLTNKTGKDISVSDLYFVISSESAYDSSFSYVEVAASTWMVDHVLDPSLPAIGGALIDGTGRACQRLYDLKPSFVEQLGTNVVPAKSSLQFAFTIPADSDDYGKYDNYAYTAFLTNDSKNGYDAVEFTVDLVDVEEYGDFNNDFNNDYA